MTNTRVVQARKQWTKVQNQAIVLNEIEMYYKVNGYQIDDRQTVTPEKKRTYEKHAVFNVMR